MKTIEKIRDVPPFLTIELIVGDPIYNIVHTKHIEINRNTTWIYSHLGKGCENLVMMKSLLTLSLTTTKFQRLKTKRVKLLMAKLQ